jgi:hypothetical protein
MQDKELTSVPALIDFLGGVATVAEWARLSPDAVFVWVDRDAIPPSWHVPLIIEGGKRGRVITPIVFGYEGDDAEWLRRHYIGAASVHS